MGGQAGDTGSADLLRLALQFPCLSLVLALLTVTVLLHSSLETQDPRQVAGGPSECHGVSCCSSEGPRQPAVLFSIAVWSHAGSPGLSVFPLLYGVWEFLVVTEGLSSSSLAFPSSLKLQAGH